MDGYQYQDYDDSQVLTSTRNTWSQRYATTPRRPAAPSFLHLHTLNNFYTVACLVLDFQPEMVNLDVLGELVPSSIGWGSKGYGSGNFSFALKIKQGIVKLPKISPDHHSFNKTSFYRDLITELRISLHIPVATCDYITQAKGLKWYPHAWMPKDSSEKILYIWPAPIYELATGTLAQLLGSRLEFPTKINLSLDVGLGLDCLHASGIVHSDMKAENILIFAHPERGHIAKLADFGCSTIWKEEDLEVRARLEGFSKLWAAPQCYTEMNYQDQCRTDVYSFGLMVWQVITDGDTPLEWLQMVEQDDQSLTVLKEHNCILPLALEAVENLLLNGSEKMICIEIFRGTLESLNDRRAEYLSPLFAAHWGHVENYRGKRDIVLPTSGYKQFVQPVFPIDIMGAYHCMGIDDRVIVQIFDSIKEVLSEARKSGDAPLVSHLLYQLFLCHHLGFGTEQDPVAAMSALAEAAKSGSFEAQNFVVQFFDAHGAEIPSELPVCDWLEEQVRADTPGAAAALEGLDPDRWERVIASMPSQSSEGAESELDLLWDLLGPPDVVDNQPFYDNCRNGHFELALKILRLYGTSDPEVFHTQVRKKSETLFNEPHESQSEEIGFSKVITWMFTQSAADTILMHKPNTMEMLRAVRKCDIGTVRDLVEYGAQRVRYSAMSMAASLHCSEILDLLIQKGSHDMGPLSPWELGGLIYVATCTNQFRSIRLHGFKFIPEVISTFEVLSKYVQLWYNDPHPVINRAKSEGLVAATTQRNLYIIKHAIHPLFTNPTSSVKHLIVFMLAGVKEMFDTLLDSIVANYGQLDQLQGISDDMDAVICLAYRRPTDFYIQRLMNPKVWLMDSLDRLMLASSGNRSHEIFCPFQLAVFNGCYETATFLAQFTGQLEWEKLDWHSLLHHVITSQETIGFGMLDYLLKIEREFPHLRTSSDKSENVIHFLSMRSSPVFGSRRVTLKVYFLKVFDRLRHLLESLGSLGMTPLELAIMQYNTIVVEALVDVGVDLNIFDREGYSAVDYVIVCRLNAIELASEGRDDSMAEELERKMNIGFNDLVSSGKMNVGRPYRGDDWDGQLDKIYEFLRKRGGTCTILPKEFELPSSLNGITKVFMYRPQEQVEID